VIPACSTCGQSVEWLRSCYSSRWRLFKDSLSTLVRGRYYFSPAGTPFFPGATVLGSRVWDDNNVSSEPSLGEVRGMPQRWDSGALPVELPFNVTVGAPACLLDGDTLSDGVPPDQAVGGFVGACFLPPAPPNPDFEFGFSIWRCPTQLFWCDAIAYLYSYHYGDLQTMLQGQFAGATVEVFPASSSYPGFAVVWHPKYCCVVSAGSETLGQVLVQALQILRGPQDYGGFGTGQLWYDYSSYMLNTIGARGGLDGRPIVFAGHSYGGCAVMVAAVRVSVAYPKTELRCLTFGAPKPGDFRLEQLLEGLYDSVALVNDSDVVAALPPSADLIAGMTDYGFGTPFPAWIAWVYPPETALLYKDQVLKNTYQRFDSRSLALYIAGVIATGSLFTVPAHKIDAYQAKIRLRCSRDYPTELGEVLGIQYTQKISANVGEVAGMTFTQLGIVTPCCPSGTDVTLPMTITAADPPNGYLVGLTGSLTWTSLTGYWTGTFTNPYGSADMQLDCAGAQWQFQMIGNPFFPNVNIGATCGNKTFNGAIHTGFGSGRATIVVGTVTPPSIWSLVFDGSTGYGLASDATFPAGSSARWVSLWMKTTTSGEQIALAYGTWGASPPWGKWWAALQFTNSAYGITNYGSNDNNGTANDDGNWHHLASSYDGSTDSVYVDGILVFSGAPSFTTTTVLNQVIMGTNGGGSSWYAGKIAEPAFGSGTLTPTQVTDLASGAADPSSMPGLLSFWKLTEGAGIHAGDSSGAGNTMTLAGGVTWSTDIPSEL
jgi:hypothetical protein